MKARMIQRLEDVSTLPKIGVYGGILMTNLFAFRSTNPQGLYAEQDPIGIDNDFYIRECADKAEITIACWGNHGSF